MFHTTSLLNCLFDSIPPEERQLLMYVVKSTFKFGQSDISLKILFQNVHIYISVSPKKTKGMMETFLRFPALHCWISEMKRCVIFIFLGFLNAMSIFLCFLNSSKNKNNFNVYFSETVFMNNFWFMLLSCFCIFLWASLILFGVGRMSSNYHLSLSARNTIRCISDSVNELLLWRSCSKGVWIRENISQEKETLNKYTRQKIVETNENKIGRENFKYWKMLYISISFHACLGI